MNKNEKVVISHLCENLQKAVNVMGHLPDDFYSRLKPEEYDLLQYLCTTVQDTIKEFNKLF